MEVTVDLNKKLANLISSPDSVKQQDAEWLSSLVAIYPYFEPLHFLLAKATQHTDTFSQHCGNAALYGDRRLLFDFINNPNALKRESLRGLEFIEINYHKSKQDTASTTEYPIFEGSSEIISETTSDDSAELNDIVATDTVLPTNDNQSEHIDSLVDHIILEQEVAPAEPENENIEEVVQGDKVTVIENEHPILEGSPEIIAESTLSEEVVFSVETNATTKNTVTSAHHEDSVSKYDDENLPYSFLWWLSKTRKQYDATYQPYVIAKKQIKSGLEHQYVEHVFHIQTPFNQDDLNNKPLKKINENRRDIKIIDSFIAADPKIKPLSLEKIDTENKGSKSAIDKNDLISETLANVYVEQMLYQKAIDVYKKLSLKFPEKSRYFDRIIKSLEKKI